MSSPPSSPDPDGVQRTPVKDMDRRGLISTIEDQKNTIQMLKDKNKMLLQVNQSATSSQSAVSATLSTVAVYEYLDENTYQLRLPSSQPTLKVYKDHLPKKGNFRFFFNTASGPGNKIIKEAIDDDDQIFPLLNGIVTGLLISSE